MLGAIIGDIAGSIYEVYEILEFKYNPNKKRNYNDRIKILDSNTPLFISKCTCTDDSNLTCAIADAVLNNKDYEKTLREYALKDLSDGLNNYERKRYGSGFISWLNGEKPGNSYGNGSAMRISPIGWLFNDINTIKEEVRKATIPSHNNIEAIIGAEAVAISIYLARNNFTKEEIKKYIQENYYKLDYNLNDLQKNYMFSSRCSDSVPQAIFCFLESNDFENAIRLAISIGGDSDTIACITGSISEAYYGIPKQIIEYGDIYIPEHIKNILEKFYNKIDNKMNEENIYGKRLKKINTDSNR